jgi:hypothetical protein
MPTPCNGSSITLPDHEGELMAIRDVVLRGYGNGTFGGTIPFVVTRGYRIGEAVPEAGYTLSFAAGQTYANRATAARIYNNASQAAQVSK